MRQGDFVMPTTAPNPNVVRESVLKQKWTAPLIDAGYNSIPQVFFNYQRELGLDIVDFNIIGQLSSFWWLPSNVARPSKATIAERIGRSPRTVQRRIRKLQDSGKIRCIARPGRPNIYLFDGLIKEATKYALAMIKEQRERRQRPHKKKHQLNLVVVK
jgi:hypothetical protein